MTRLTYPSVPADFAGEGVWRWDASGWKQLTASDATHLTIDTAGDVAASFNTGVFRYQDASGWSLLSGGLAGALAMDANGNLVTDFTGLGVWFDSNQTGWQELTPADAALLAVDI